MPEYLLEQYISRTDAAAVAAGARRARQAADELRREGTPVRYLRSIFVPDDETCFYFYEAVSVEAAREAARRAAIPVESLAEAITDSRGGEYEQ